MSERTVIGGTSYEAVGSSSSNLLLKCNGTARIQWGNKLIDLIKNGKLAAENQEFIFNVSDESEIKQDGIYILSTDEITQLWACKKGQKHNLTEANLYISAGNKQEITAEQKTQALQNIGMYYNTLEEAKNSGMKNGIVYIVETQSLYTIKEGEFKIFEGSATITVEDDNTEEGVINGSLKIVLSVGGFEYIVLTNNTITVNKSIVMSEFSEIKSSGANSFTGYRLYTQNSKSYLDVDVINVRDGITTDLQQDEYINITFAELITQVTNSQLKPHKWYKLTDFQNPWTCYSKSSTYRPLLLRALTFNSFYEYGYLYDNQDVIIKYDYSYQIPILYIYGNETTTICPECGSEMTDGSCVNCGYQLTNSEIITTKGKITWMKDQYGNEANFDFLDYIDSDNSTRYYNYNMPSIFPPNSTNNKIQVFNLKGTEFELNEDESTYSLKTKGTVLQFGNYEESLSTYSESEDIKFLEMNNNTLVINGNFIINESCSKFNNNNIDNIDIVTINGSMINNSFSELKNCTLNANFTNTSFKAIENVTFEQGELKNITCEDDYRPKPPIELNSENQELLYTPIEDKFVYVNNNILYVESLSQQKFSRGMIIMHSGQEDIPSGWGICDGRTYNYKGESITTPNLVGRFIKAVSDKSEVQSVNVRNGGNDNNFTLLEEHLPSHSHPHTSHTHAINVSASGTSELEVPKIQTTTGNAITSLDGYTANPSGDFIKQAPEIVRGTCSIRISGQTETSISQEQSKTWKNTPITIEPNYYSLIFIMKL